MSSAALRVLFVDDDLLDRVAFERLVRKQQLPYDYTLADSAQAARKHLAAERFDIVITDFSLADGNCLELLAEFKNVPFVVVTGTGSEETAVEAMKLGARDYLIKDPDGHHLTVLPATVRNVLERNAAEAELQRHREHLEELVRERTAELVAEIRERLRTEEEKRVLQEQLYHAQKMEAVGQLASGIAHDFNNLLTVIFSNVDLIRQQLPQDQEKSIGACLEAIWEAARQAMGVTRSLLIFARKVPGEKKPVDLRATVERTVRMIRRALPASIELVTETTGETPIWTFADETQIQQVIMNLAVNARDAMPGGGTLRIAVGPAGGPGDGRADESKGRQTALVCLTVSDTGAGIPPDIQTRIFEPFFSTKPRGAGTGLGLSIIDGIVKEHGGRIEVQSEVGKGATFRVILPACEPGVEAEAKEPPSGGPPGRGEKILLAEDDEYVGTVLATRLEVDGYGVIRAKDGRSMLEACRQHGEAIRLLVVDFDLPKRNGIDCLKDLRAEGRHTPAILMTGSAEVDLTERLPSDTRLLRKPFQVVELTRMITEALA
ncbi:MAG: response regulator [Phycisphaerae bacterium]